MFSTEITDQDALALFWWLSPNNPQDSNNSLILCAYNWIEYCELACAMKMKSKTLPSLGGVEHHHSNRTIITKWGLGNVPIKIGFVKPDCNEEHNWYDWLIQMFEDDVQGIMPSNWISGSGNFKLTIRACSWQAWNQGPSEIEGNLESKDIKGWHSDILSLSLTHSMMSIAKVSCTSHCQYNFLFLLQGNWSTSNELNTKLGPWMIPPVHPSGFRYLGSSIQHSLGCWFPKKLSWQCWFSETTNVVTRWLRVVLNHTWHGKWNLKSLSTMIQSNKGLWELSKMKWTRLCTSGGCQSWAQFHLNEKLYTLSIILKQEERVWLFRKKNWPWKCFKVGLPMQNLHFVFGKCWQEKAMSHLISPTFFWIGPVQLLTSSAFKISRLIAGCEHLSNTCFSRFVQNWVLENVWNSCSQNFMLT